MFTRLLVIQFSLLLVSPELMSAKMNRNRPHDELSAQDKQHIIERIKTIAKRDQYYRRLLSFGTADLEKIKEVEKLGAKERFAWIAQNKSSLSKAQRADLWQKQRKYDALNHQEFVTIVKRFGYPSAERLGTKTDELFIILLHPANEPEHMDTHLKQMTKLLKPEVLAGRMPPKKFALFYDNILCKILKRTQLYGTNQVYNRKTQSIDPPMITDIGQTNKARREIGLAELKEGEFQLAQKRSDEN